eukprot:TRINITY_DN66421_c2_g6_i1.p1 TRINITY_DN66421_c2_g6~~TRINITY_DN66421_c2_g6_i1.p1  ORF type:complete len:254 (+),score=35.63 TRINITY_DN66421_c2_g6_i1:207-968(+)
MSAGYAASRTGPRSTRRSPSRSRGATMASLGRCAGAVAIISIAIFIVCAGSADALSLSGTTRSSKAKRLWPKTDKEGFCVYVYKCPPNNANQAPRLGRNGEGWVYVGKSTECGERVGVHSKNFEFLTLTKAVYEGFKDSRTLNPPVSLTERNDPGNHDVCIIQQCAGRRLELYVAPLQPTGTDQDRESKLTMNENGAIDWFQTKIHGCNRVGGGVQLSDNYKYAVKNKINTMSLVNNQLVSECLESPRPFVSE